MQIKMDEEMDFRPNTPALLFLKYGMRAKVHEPPEKVGLQQRELA